MFLKHTLRGYSYLQFLKQKYQFAQPPKKRTQAPKLLKKQSTKIDPKDIDYNKIPQQYRKGVKAFVEAKNMMVSSQAQIQQISLRQVILEERQKFKNSLQNMDQSLKTKQLKVQGQDKQQTEKRIENTDINYYDLTKALKFMSYVSSTLLLSNALGYIILNSFKKYQFLGFFLGVSLNPSIIALTGISISFNCASWIIRQSLHLQIKDPKQLTFDKISLTGCSKLMYFEGFLICVQIAALSIYLMKSIPFQSFENLIIAFVLSQGHMIYNIIKATGGYRFQIFSKILITFIFGTFFIGSLTYSLFSKIDDCKNLQIYGDVMNSAQKGTLNENFQLKKGYNRFLSQLKTQQITIFSGDKINKETL